MRYHNKEKKLLGIPTSDKEIYDIVKAWFVISLAFTILLAESLISPEAIVYFFIAAFTVGTGFLFHELAHKFVAQKYRCWAEFRSFDHMLVLALVFSFFGFILAAPGAVMIKGSMLKKEYGHISAAGPLMNFLLAGIFFVISFSPVDIIALTGNYGFLINTWLGLFNLIPFAMFDGAKIFRWNKVIWGCMVAVGILFLGMTGIFS